MKERLTGAIILVVLIVLLVPELLSGPEHPTNPAPAAATSSPEEPPLRSYTINLADDSHPHGVAGTGNGPTNGPAMPQPSGPDQAGGTQSGSAGTQTQAPVGGAQSAQSEEAAPSSDSQSESTTQGSSANSNASSAATQAQATPPPPSQAAPSQQAQHQSEKPAPQKAAAKPHTPAPTPPNTTTTPEGGGWYVQLGVFKVRENAERLASELHGKGFKTSVSAITSASQKLYRVRVGPASNRAAAQDMQGRLHDVCRTGCAVVPSS